MMYHGGEADVASRVQAGQPRCRDLTSIRDKKFLLLQSISNLALRPTQSATQWLPCGGSLPGSKAAEA